MEIKVFSVYDSKVGAYLQPFFLTSRGEAIRVFSDLVDDPKTQFNKHPEDYTLFELGSYDNEKGNFKNNLTPYSLGLATEFRKIEDPARLAADSKSWHDYNNEQRT